MPLHFENKENYLLKLKNISTVIYLHLFQPSLTSLRFEWLKSVTVCITLLRSFNTNTICNRREDSRTKINFPRQFQIFKKANPWICYTNHSVQRKIFSLYCITNRYMILSMFIIRFDNSWLLISFISAPLNQLAHWKLTRL